MKRIIALILTVFIILFVFAGCSESTEINDNTVAEHSISFVVDAHNSSANQSVIRAYEALCGAVVNGDEDVLFNTSLIGDVNKLFYSNFPLSYLVSKIEINSDNSGVVIIYDNSAETHLKAVSVFKEKVNSILSDCGYGKVNNNVFIVNLYSFITKNTQLVTQSNYAYDVIVNSLGYSYSISNAFSYLLNQAGINASVVNSTNENGICFMVEADFNGGKYIFNPFEEAKENSGKALCYFALDYSDLSESGYSDVRYSDGDSVVFDDSGYAQSDFRNSVAYILDGNNLSITKNNGEIVQIAL